MAFSGDALTEGLVEIRQHVGEAFILSTCNRTEIYAVSHEGYDSRNQVFDFLSGYHHVPTAMLESASYTHAGDEAVSHLFRVASGLNSLVLGEPQILSQIREAMGHAREAGALGPVLQRLTTDALRTGKRARTETDIARNRVSIAHAAVDLAFHEMDTLADKSVVILGAGKMATLTAKLIRARGVGQLTIVNRSFDKAQELADTVQGHAAPTTHLASVIAEADLVIGAVMVDDPMVDASHIVRRNKALWMIDISVPRSISSDCGLHMGVHVRDVDALEPFAEETRRQYADEVNKVERLVQNAVGSFEEWTRSRSGARAIARLHRRNDAIREAELERTMKRLAHLSDRDQNLVRALAHAITQKLQHDPILALREAETEASAQHILDILGVREDSTPT